MNFQNTVFESPPSAINAESEEFKFEHLFKVTFDEEEAKKNKGKALAFLQIYNRNNNEMIGGKFKLNLGWYVKKLQKFK